MVYSLLSLITADEQKLINVDYNMPCCEVYADATFASLQTSRDFRILEYASVFATAASGGEKPIQTTGVHCRIIESSAVTKRPMSHPPVVK